MSRNFSLAATFVASVIAQAFFAQNARAERVAKTAYAYEYINPVYATVSMALARSNDMDLQLPVQSLQVEVIPGRDSVPLLEGHGKMPFMFYPQADKTAPVVFVLSGLGGGSTTGTTGYLADRLALAGFQVISLESTFLWEFLISAGANSLPGVLDEDSADLYRAMHAAFGKVVAENGIRPRAVDVVGLSLGASEAAMIAGIDSRSERPFRFEKVILVNPPVDLAYGAQILDSFYAIALKMGEDNAMRLMGRVYKTGDELISADIESPSYWANLMRRFPLTLDEATFLIGASFHQSLSDVIFASQQVHDLGILKMPASKYSPSLRLEESTKFLFQHYLAYFVLPTWAARHGIANPTAADLAPHSTLRPLEAELKANPNLYLFHNADDFLLAPGDLEWLEGVFGSRAKIYPHGGHLGNIWFEKNRNDLIELLK